LPESPPADHSLEFFVGGYSAGSDIAEVWKFSIVNGALAAAAQQFPGTESAFVLWAGQPEALNRLLLGYSQHLPAALLEAGLAEDQLPVVMAKLPSFVATPLAEDPMPTGDAIALAQFLVDVTKRYVHFLRGADTVGGDTDVATVTRHEGFKWIQRKHHYPRELNLETDHV
jgi:hypothetical protein